MKFVKAPKKVNTSIKCINYCGMFFEIIALPPDLRK